MHNARKKAFRGQVTPSPSPSPPAARNEPDPQTVSSAMPVITHDDITKTAADNLQAQGGAPQSTTASVSENALATETEQDKPAGTGEPGEGKPNEADGNDMGATPKTPPRSQPVENTNPSDSNKQNTQPATAPVAKPSGPPAPSVRPRGTAKKQAKTNE